MIDLYLRADTAEALAEACPFLRGTDPETGEPIWLLSGEGFAFDPIGPIVTTPGTYDEDGEELTPPVIDSRFHANLRCVGEPVADLVSEAMIVSPAEPMRVWG